MLSKFFLPETIAVVGASKSPGKVGHALVRNILDGGFKGKVIPVNPKAEEVLGLKCYATIKDYPGEVDLAIIAVPARITEAAINGQLEKGVKSIVVITAGFKEIGAEGKELESRIASACKEAGARMLGPNVVGLINTHHKLNASFALSMPKKGTISVIAQSGAICTVLLDWAKAQGIGLGKLISIGNKADITEVDLLPELAADKHTKVILGYLEDINAGKEFIRAAETASARKPIVILKAGTTSAGKRAASSHTGSLAGVDTAYAAAFRRSGVIRAESFNDLADYSIAFSMQPLPGGERVSVITNAGGIGILAADAVENSGLRMAELGEQTREKLAEFLSPAASLLNPIDILGDSSPEQYAKTVDTIQQDSGVDAIVMLFAPQAMTDPTNTVKEVSKVLKREKPILASFMGGYGVSKARKELLKKKIPSYDSAERAVASLKAMSMYSRWLRRPPRVVARFPVNRQRVERIISRYEKTGKSQIGEVEAKQILSAYDFCIPEGAVATSSDEAVEIAERLGYPIAIKIYSPDVIHKSDYGGVKLNLGSSEAVRDAFDLMMMRINNRLPDAKLNGAYVEKMAGKGREVILGMTRDRQFGPMLMFGLGGIFVEVMKDVAFNLAPITEEEAMQMLGSTRSYALLKGARGQAGVDIRQIAAGLQRISQLVTDFSQIAELDINPLFVKKVGMEAVVADARISLNLGE